MKYQVGDLFVSKTCKGLILDIFMDTSSNVEKISVIYYEPLTYYTCIYTKPSLDCILQHLGGWTYYPVVKQ